MTPQEINNKIAAFRDVIRQDIADSIASFLERNDGLATLKGDNYHGYPRIYDKNDHCVVSDIRGIRFQGDDKKVILLVIGTGRKRVRLDKLDIDEQLQVLEFLHYDN